MKKFVLVFAIFLTACAHTHNDGFKEKEVVTETVYVIRKATDQQKNLPPMPPPLNVEKADQLQLAEWIVKSEQRMMDLESIIRRLVEFYEKPITEEERKKLEQDKKATTTKK